MREEYKGSIRVGFSGIPAIELKTLISRKGASALERFSIATRRRKFTLRNDWEVDLGDIDYVKELNGTVVIPKNNANSTANVFDGASVPAPWLISLLTIGVLRPLGVMLIGSIIHDYAYTHGCLWVKANGELKKVALKRHHADKLFRDIIGTVNGLPLVGYIAWLAVRIAWVLVPYNKTYHTGRKPIPEYLFVSLILLAVIFIADKWGGISLYLFLGVYIAFYLASLLLQKRYE